MDKAIQGIRRSESVKRAKTYNEPTKCRIYGSKKNYVEAIYPILDFTDKDIEEFVKERDVKLHPLYYNEDGSLNIKKRLGCMGCPLKSNNGLADFKANPKLVRAWLRAGKKWWDSKPNIESRKNTGIYTSCLCQVYSSIHTKGVWLLLGEGYLTTA